MLLDAIVIVLLAVLAYAWAGYPLMLAMLGGRRRDGSPGPDDAACHPVAILLSAHNEEACIGERVKNILALDYPRDRLTVHVGSDGSADRTAEIVRELARRDDRVVIHQFIENRGKVAVLKDLVGEAGDRRLETADNGQRILVFTDANTVFRKDALNKLVRHFADPAIGAVCGKLELKGGSPEGLYWRLENRFKQWESSIDSCLGVNGAIYAVRPELFWRGIPDNTMVDDFVLGMKVREQGGRVLYDPDAVAEEELPELSAEWVRRVRIGAGDYQALSFCRRCLCPSYGRFAWMFWSHKVLRWFTPHLLLVLLPCAVAGAVWRSWLSAAVLALFGLLALCALGGGGAGPSRLPCAGVFRACRHFLVMQAALWAGWMRYRRGGLRGTWERTPR